jgi:hypothetical protein
VRLGSDGTNTDQDAHGTKEDENEDTHDCLLDLFELLEKNEMDLLDRVGFCVSNKKSRVCNIKTEEPR